MPRQAPLRTAAAGDAGVVGSLCRTHQGTGYGGRWSQANGPDPRSIAAKGGDVRLHHDPRQFVEGDLRFPAQQAGGFGGVRAWRAGAMGPSRLNVPNGVARATAPVPLSEWTRPWADAPLPARRSRCGFLPPSSCCCFAHYGTCKSPSHVRTRAVASYGLQATHAAANTSKGTLTASHSRCQSFPRQSRSSAPRPEIEMLLPSVSLTGANGVRLLAALTPPAVGPAAARTGLAEAAAGVWAGQEGSRLAFRGRAYVPGWAGHLLRQVRRRK